MEPDYAHVTDSLVPTKPGQEALFAYLGPSYLLCPGNQTGPGWPLGAWFALMQAPHAPVEAQRRCAAHANAANPTNCFL